MDNIPENLPLRDIHLPEAVSWWPPAPGWWLVMIIIVVVIIAAVWLYRRYNRYRNSPVRLAQLELDQIRTEYSSHQDQQQLIKDLSGLLRRTTVSIYPRKNVASITGKDWLNFLDTSMGDQPFSAGVGRILESGPYQQQSAADPDDLFDLCEHWLNNIRQDKAA